MVVALVVKGTSWLPPKEQVQVQLLAGVLILASMVKRTSRGPAKAEFLVRVQVGALWPNSKRQRDPAVNRGCAGSTPAGHPEASAARRDEHPSCKGARAGSSPAAGSE